MTSVAVIGGGAAGLGAAHALLAAGVDVALFEAAPQPGGNCFGVPVRGRDGVVHTVDAGVSDFNRTTFHGCVALFEELGLASVPIDTSASFATAAGRPVASCHDGRWQLDAAYGEAASLAHEVAEFRWRCLEVLDEARGTDCTVDAYLDRLGASRAFREVYLLPRAMGCFPSRDVAPGQLSMRRLVEFWQMHGVVGKAPADRHTLVGGMQRWPVAFAKWFTARGGQLHCGQRVLGVARHGKRVEIRTVGRDDRHQRFVARHVVFANHAHEVLPLLDDASPALRRALGRFPHQRARVVVHRDARLVGEDRARWGAFHYVLPHGGLPAVRPTITFFTNRLARLPASLPDVFVTVNPHLEPRPELVLAERFFVHPVATRQQPAAEAAVMALQGQRRTWFAGSHLRRPFVHESALQSGRAAAELLLRQERGVRRTCLVA